MIVRADKSSNNAYFLGALGIMEAWGKSFQAQRDADIKDANSNSAKAGRAVGNVVGGVIGVVGSAANWALFGSINPDDPRNANVADGLKDGINSIKSGLSGK